MKLEVLPARHGDCMLLHYGSNDDPRLALIDGGPAGVYTGHLLPRLAELRKERDLEDHQPLKIDLLIVSHVDDDHVNGVVRLLRDMKKDHDADRPPKFRIERLWHNSFDDIIGNDESETKASLTKQFGTASAGMDDIPEDALEDHRDWQVLASIAQGHEIRELAKALDIPVNADFDEKLIQASDDGKQGFREVVKEAGTTFTVLGPLTRELKELEEKHDEWLKKQNKKRDSGEATLAAFRDKSVANLASIVLLVEHDDKRILLTGDARGDKIVEALGPRGLVTRDGKLKVDVHKVAHHGSDNNVTVEFFEQIPGDHYVLSGDGGHGNPERSCLEWIEEARNGDAYTLQFTYPIAVIDARREEIHNRHADNDPDHAFDPEKHAIGTFLAGLPDRVTIMAPETDD